MDIRQNPLLLSFSLGRWFGINVRISIWFLLIPVVLCSHLGVRLGLAISGILFVSILIHEFAHILACRATGGSGHEVLLWPLGGLAFTNPAPSFFSEVWTIIAGPLSNAVLCLACLVPVLQSDRLAECASLLTVPGVALRGDWVRDLILLTFSVNLKLLALNLLPVSPLDGGQLSYAIAKLYWPKSIARIGTLWVGLAVCLLLWVAGSITDNGPFGLLVLSSLLFMFCFVEFVIAQFSRQFEDSYLGEDLTEDYLRAQDDDEEERRPGPIARWRQQREQQRREKEQQLRQETERKVDELLEKVHLHGINSLTDAERRFLTRASNKYRSQG